MKGERNASVRAVHVGRVLDNNDPSGAGGLKLQVDALVDGAELSREYVPPAFPFAGADEGFFFVPEKGAQVEVEVTADPEASTEDLNPRWRATLYSDLDSVPAEFRSNPTKRGGIKFGKVVLTFDKALDRLAAVSSNVRLGTEEASHPLVRGDTFNDALSTKLSAEATLLDAANVLESAWAAVMVTLGGLTPGVPATTDMLIAISVAMTAPIATYQAALATYKAAVEALNNARATWLSTRCKTE